MRTVGLSSRLFFNVAIYRSALLTRLQMEQEKGTTTSRSLKVRIAPARRSYRWVSYKVGVLIYYPRGTHRVPQPTRGIAAHPV